MASFMSRIKPTISTRTVHIKLFPTPRSFPERREVLRVLERYGEVTHFRSFKYDRKPPIHNAWIAMFREESSAHELVMASPLRYRLVAEPALSDATAEASPEEEGSESIVPEEKLFELNASMTEFDHGLYLKAHDTNPLGGPFIPVQPNRSYIAASLERCIPQSPWASGLKDWETDRLQWRNDELSDLSDQQGKYNDPSSRSAYQKNKDWRRKTQRSIPEVMRGLRNLYRAREDDPQEQQSTGVGQKRPPLTGLFGR